MDVEVVSTIKINETESKIGIKIPDPTDAKAIEKKIHNLSLAVTRALILDLQEQGIKVKNTIESKIESDIAKLKSLKESKQ